MRADTIFVFQQLQISFVQNKTVALHSINITFASNKFTVWFMVIFRRFFYVAALFLKTKMLIFGDINHGLVLYYFVKEGISYKEMKNFPHIIRSRRFNNIHEFSYLFSDML